MKEFIKKLLSNNTQSSMRFCLLTGLLITIAIVICILIIAFKYSVWNLSLDVIDKLTYLIGVILTSLVLGKTIQKFAEVKEEKKDVNGK
jgi:hypothetical protein